MGGELPDSVAGRVSTIELYPKKRISLIGADFSAFRGARYTGRDEETTSYYDKFGLRYLVYEKDSADGRFHAGDLKRIEYGPSDEDTEKYANKGKSSSKKVKPAGVNLQTSPGSAPCQYVEKRPI